MIVCTLPARKYACPAFPGFNLQIAIYDPVGGDRCNLAWKCWITWNWRFSISGIVGWIFDMADIHVGRLTWLCMYVISGHIIVAAFRPIIKSRQCLWRRDMSFGQYIRRHSFMVIVCVHYVYAYWPSKLFVSSPEALSALALLDRQDGDTLVGAKRPLLRWLLRTSSRTW